MDRDQLQTIEQNLLDLEKWKTYQCTIYSEYFAFTVRLIYWKTILPSLVNIELRGLFMKNGFIYTEIWS